jgi:hypothetical protein
MRPALRLSAATLPQPHVRTAAILGDELDAGGSKRRGLPGIAL